MSGLKLPQSIKGAQKNQSGGVYPSKGREQSSSKNQHSKALTKDGKTFSAAKNIISAASGRQNPEWLRHDYVDVIRDIHRGKKHWYESDMNFTSSSFYNPRAPSSNMSSSSRSSRLGPAQTYEAYSLSLGKFHHNYASPITPKIGSLEKRNFDKRRTTIKIGHYSWVDTNVV